MYLLPDDIHIRITMSCSAAKELLGRVSFALKEIRRDLLNALDNAINKMLEFFNLIGVSCLFRLRGFVFCSASGISAYFISCSGKDEIQQPIK